MNTASILIKIDPQLKLKAQKTAEKMGLSLTSVINHYLKDFITTEAITFNVRDEVPNEYFKRTLAKARKNWKEGKTSPVFDNIKDNLEWLEKQGI